ncbi:MAG TPA: hypothetical protein VGI88_10845 [Verrucomicrobiae bacterium]|jgi:hypothetical protein
MNTSEQLLKNNLESAQEKPSRLRALARLANHGGVAIEIILILLSVIIGVDHLLRTDPPNLLRQELVGVGVIACMLGCLGLYLGLMNRALKRDANQTDNEPKEMRK